MQVQHMQHMFGASACATFLDSFLVQWNFNGHLGDFFMHLSGAATSQHAEDEDEDGDAADAGCDFFCDRLLLALNCNMRPLRRFSAKEVSRILCFFSLVVGDRDVDEDEEDVEVSLPVS